MWNSPNAEEKGGSLYSIEEIRALVYPLSMMLDELRSLPVARVVDQPVLQRLNPEQIEYALYEVFQALLEPEPFPSGGQRSYQEALVFELLLRVYSHVEIEATDEEVFSDSARRAVWTSLQLLALKSTEFSITFANHMDELGLDPETPSVHCSPKLTRQVWNDFILGLDGLWSEFLWDDDWQYALPEEAEEEAKAEAHILGLEIGLAYDRPRNPTREELQAARHYLDFLSERDADFALLD